MLFQRRVRLGSLLLGTAAAIMNLAGSCLAGTPGAATPPASSPAVASPAPGTPAAAPPTKRVGTLLLERCPDVAAYCGHLDRPLDPAGTIPGRISVHFEFYLHRKPGPAVGTLVATEGGPGYPATLSRDDYLDLFKPLMSNRDIVLMDNRGTGKSGAIDCHELQTGERWTEERVAACGNSLGDRAPFYSTAYAADDLAAILQALHLNRIDLYGDSYGTYFEQAFATRHGQLLRSIVLDGAYPLGGPDYAWYPTYAPAMRDKFNLTCERFAPCARSPGNSLTHVQPALEALRAHPFPATGYDEDGAQRHFEANASQLAIVMFGGAPALTTARETDAAARAFAQGDPLPLLRLMAETASAVDSRDPTADPAQWSAGLAAAVMCQDPPQIFDMTLPPTARAADRARALAERRRDAPDTYAPFTIDEYRGMPLDYNFIDECVGWPVAPPGHPASQVGVNAVYPDVPALVISGELDDITTPADGAAVAHAFRRGTQIRIANSFHVNALPRARSACAADIVRRFMATLDTGDTSCAAKVPPLRLVPQFATRVDQLEPVTALPGNTADTSRLKAAMAAVMTAGDVLARVTGNASGHGRGLRGGSYTLTRDAHGIRVNLNKVQFVDDIAISGTLQRAASRGGMVHADLQVWSANESAAPHLEGRLRVQWNDAEAEPQARIRGSLRSTVIAAQTAAP
jgi:pimeloyl-ACP methyl ester carboxylesterase